MDDDVIRDMYEDSQKELKTAHKELHRKHSMYLRELRRNVDTNELLNKIRELVDQPYPDEIDDTFLRHNIRALLEKAGK